MLSINSHQVTALLALCLPIALCYKIQNGWEKTIYLVSSVLLVSAFKPSPIVMGLIISLTLILSLRNPRYYFNTYLFFLVMAIGNWTSPSLVELLLLVLIVFINIEFDQRGAKYIIPSFSISILLYIINSSSITSAPLVVFGMLTSFTLLFWVIFTKATHLKNIDEFFTLCLVSTVFKMIIDQNINQLTILQFNTWSIFNLCVISYVIIRLLIFNSHSSKSSFLKLIAISIYIPTISPQITSQSSETSIALIAIIIGAALFRKLEFNNLIDRVLRLLIGAIIISIQVYIAQSFDLNALIALVAVLLISTELYYLIKTIEKQQAAIMPNKYRERLPQIAFISLAFGWLCTLWYILYYVRKIQG